MSDDSQPDSGPARPLDSLRPFLVAANVRGEIVPARYHVGDGIGRTGDLVLGMVSPEPGHRVKVLDQERCAHELPGPVRVVAVLGPRDSSTHVCAEIPADGLRVTDGSELHWVAGESGIVGQLERDAPTHSVHRPESAIRFLCEGLLFGPDGMPVNIRSFAASMTEKRSAKPIVLIAATATEAGKTVLSGEIIHRLTQAGLRVGAIKVTGTGGARDSMHHKKCGAVQVLDSVDAGLISTHGDTEEFRARIPSLFRALDVPEVDLIVAELGGDLVSANNPALFGIDEVIDNTLMLAVISNDALGAAGVNAINESRFGFPPARLRHLTSPFRNHAGMQRRMALAGVPDCYDPRSPDDLAEIAAQICRALKARYT